ncbi:hypothetical protein [Pandoravirus japonicus]|uniref:Uncharacterized protein n=1 Tax=Pandoravirus japonicus TaxID=2823154 RepID=A0A811BQ55_9VIRU|nr:hypothetical protein [Pandoravirus japonicus]
MAPPSLLVAAVAAVLSFCASPFGRGRHCRPTASFFPLVKKKNKKKNSPRRHQRRPRRRRRHLWPQKGHDRRRCRRRVVDGATTKAQTEEKKTPFPLLPTAHNNNCHCPDDDNTGDGQEHQRLPKETTTPLARARNPHFDALLMLPTLTSQTTSTAPTSPTTTAVTHRHQKKAQPHPTRHQDSRNIGDDHHLRTQQQQHAPSLPPSFFLLRGPLGGLFLPCLSSPSSSSLSRSLSSSSPSSSLPSSSASTRARGPRPLVAFFFLS